MALTNIIPWKHRVVTCITFAEGVTVEQVRNMLERMDAAGKLEFVPRANVMAILDEEYPVPYIP